MNVATLLMMVSFAMTAQATEPMGTPLWFFIVLGLIILAILLWGVLSRSWETTAADKEQAARAAAAPPAVEPMKVEEPVSVMEPEVEEMAPAPAFVEEPVMEAAPEMEAAMAEPFADMPYTVEVAEPMFPERVEAVMLEPEPPPAPDDLLLIEGIGPKIAQVLADAGITTFAALSQTDVPTLERIVREDAGITVAFPDSWPRQAEMLATGDMEAFQRYTDELKGGRHVEPDQD